MHDLRVSIECQTIKTGSLSLGVSKTQTPLLQIAAAIEADSYAAYTSAICASAERNHRQWQMMKLQTRIRRPRTSDSSMIWCRLLKVLARMAMHKRRVRF